MDQHPIFSSWFFRAYSLLWQLAQPYLRWRRLKEGWQERLAQPGWCPQVQVWLQAASGGEAHLALAILKAMPEATCLTVLVTTWTKQGRSILENGQKDLREERPGIHLIVRYAPLDSPQVVSRAINQAKPNVLILLETELWPGLLAACAAQEIPVYLLNGRMSKTSYELYKIIAPILRKFPVRRIEAVSVADAERFESIFGHQAQPEGTFVMPNIKFDRAVLQAQAPLAPTWGPLFRKACPMILFASVRRQEEGRIAPLLAPLLRACPQAALVMAPRHMQQVQAWMKRLHDLGLNPLLASELELYHAVEPGRVVVWDLFGTLPDVYATADAAFVGGSLSLGGQNFLEALAGGVVPCVGTSLDNFHWALGEDQAPSLAEAGLLHICQNMKELSEQLVASATGRKDRELIRQRFLDWLAPRTGGAAHAATIILQAVSQQNTDVS